MEKKNHCYALKLRNSKIPQFIGYSQNENKFFTTNLVFLDYCPKFDSPKKAEFYLDFNKDDIKKDLDDWKLPDADFRKNFIVKRFKAESSGEKSESVVATLSRLFG